MSGSTAGERLAGVLAAAGVDCVFGLPGTQTVPFYESLRRSRVRSVLATSELTAAFMAGGWARMTGRPGVVLTIPGPGFAWALPGVAEAQLDSVPLLHLTGAPPRSAEGRKFLQQELAQREIAAPLAKRVIDWDGSTDIAAAAAEALAAAMAGEPGPVVLQLASSRLHEAGTDAPLPPLPALPEPPSLDELVRRVAACRRPVLFVGQGVLGHGMELRALAEALGAPVVTTPSARGVLPEQHPLALGFDPFAGSLEEVNRLFDRADGILVIGAKLGHNGTAGFGLILPADRLLHVDASREVIGANYPVSHGVVADAGSALRHLGARAARAGWDSAELAAHREAIRRKPAFPLEPRVAGTPDGSAASFFGALRRSLPDDGVLVLDSGLHQIMARRHFEVRSERGLLMPTDLQSMGFAIPTAIGARVAAPQRPVVALLGDGGFAMNGLELLTAVREGLALTIAVFVDGRLGQIRLQQLQEYGREHSVDLVNPDFGLLAEALGIGYARVGEDAESVLRGAIGSPGVTLVEVPVGDAPSLARTAAVARVRGNARRTVPPGLLALLKKLLGRAR